MSAFANTSFWVAFLMAGIIAQAALPGLDTLLLGIILITEERDYKTMVWFVPSVVLLQEGMGTQAFGASLVCVTLSLIFFYLCSRLATASRAGFYVVLSMVMGGVRFLVDWFFANLEGLAFVTEHLFGDALIETLYILAGWTLLRHLRPIASQKESGHEA